MTEPQLRDADLRWLPTALKLAQTAAWELALLTRTLRWTAGAEALLGFPSGHLDRLDDLLLAVTEPHRQRLRDALLVPRGAPFELDVPISHQDGRPLVIRIRGEHRPGAKTAAVLGTVSDVTRGTAEQARTRLAASVFDNAPEAMIVTTATGAVVEVNRAFTEILGYTPAEVVGETPRLWKSDHHSPAFYAEMWRCLDGVGAWQGEIWNRRRNGEAFPAWLRIVSVAGGEAGTDHYVATMTDLTRATGLDAELGKLAHHDRLTGLPNRQLALTLVEHAVARARRNGSPLALLVLDVDGFQLVNESLGHRCGDELLRAMTARLKHRLRASDTLARLGGDELLVLAEDVDGPTSVAHLAERLRCAAHAPFDIDGRELYVTLSVGIALFPRDGADAETLTRHADAALHRSKREGRDRYSFYTLGLTLHANERLGLAGALRQAIDEEALEVHYQPQVALEDGSVLGVEALLRWRHPLHGAIPPARFVPLAEESGLIVRLGEYVLRRACHQMRRWLDDGRSIGHVSVNVSGAQLVRGDIVTLMRAALEDSRLPPERLFLEMTETALVDTSRHKEAVLALRELGVTLSIDDFGTGHSSLVHLKQLTVDELKIDRTFVAGLPSAPNDVAIVRAVLAMGSALGLSVIAEGVESEAQRRALLALGCRRGQGWLFAPAMSAAALEDMIGARRGAWRVPAREAGAYRTAQRTPEARGRARDQGEVTGAGPIEV